MDETNIPPHQDGNPDPGRFLLDHKPKKPSSMKIVGINMAVFAAYTILCELGAKDGAAILDMFLIGIHVLVGIVLAIVNRSWAWLLSALIVLVIGFSTCVGMVNFNGH
ncbi:hypothetical protein AAFN85_04550 [Mucilaginibacter sp. CAU 1740]|uniref:hypothetical protein n=1 Tax=Mucilaginibacter sp. CAU 1740 TaxID=3140365 RepID=UPI00325C1F45